MDSPAFIRARHVTLAPADGPSALILASCFLRYAIAGWLRSEPLLQLNSIARLPLLPAGVAVVKTWEADVIMQQQSGDVYATPETLVDVTFVPSPSRSTILASSAADALIELQSAHSHTHINIDVASLLHSSHDERLLAWSAWEFLPHCIISTCV